MSKKLIPSYYQALISLIAATFFWGSTFVFTKILIVYFSSLELLFLRTALTSFLLYLLFYGKIKISTNIFKNRLILLFSVFGFLTFFFQTISLKYTSTANSAFISSMFIIIIPLLKRIHFKEKIKKNIWKAAIIAMIGLYLMAFGLSLKLKFDLGCIYSILCAVCYAYYIVILEPLSKVYKGCELMFFSFTIISLMSLAVICPTDSILFLNRLKNPYISTVLILFAVIGSIIPYLLMAKGQKVISAQVSGLVYSLEPVFATGLAYIILFEKVNINQTIGAFILLLAVISIIFPQKFCT